jgi:tRNA-specific 2-thiouridylase
MISGGLDSFLAIKLLQLQEIEVIGVHFTSAFFNQSQKVLEIAALLKIEMRIIDFTREHLNMMKNPQFGFGKNLNPCVDCHGLMFLKASELLDKTKKEFLASGEVVGQRPMSQNLKSLDKVEDYSGQNGYLLRPLSAKLLRPTIPESEGWVDRSKLMGIYGRGRNPQYKLAKELNLPIISKPAGGCRLTDPEFTRRIKKLYGSMDNEMLMRACSYGRVMELASGKTVVIARKQEESIQLEALSSQLLIKGDLHPGPLIRGFGDFSRDEILWCMKLFSYFSRYKGKERLSILVNGLPEWVEPFEIQELDPFIRANLL